MSLDVYLIGSTSTPRKGGIFVRENGATKQISREEWDKAHPFTEPVTVAEPEVAEVYWRNITHNLGKMADQAGIYEALWRPDEISITKAKQLVEPLQAGLMRLRSEPEKFKAFNPSNGWGDYDGLVAFVDDYLGACLANPDADVRVSR